MLSSLFIDRLPENARIGGVQKESWFYAAHICICDCRNQHPSYAKAGIQEWDNGYKIYLHGCLGLWVSDLKQLYLFWLILKTWGTRTNATLLILANFNDVGDQRTECRGTCFGPSRPNSVNNLHDFPSQYPRDAKVVGGQRRCSGFYLLCPYILYITTTGLLIFILLFALSSREQFTVKH